MFDTQLILRHLVLYPFPFKLFNPPHKETSSIDLEGFEQSVSFRPTLRPGRWPL